MPDDDERGTAASIGLCADCRHHRVQRSRRGSAFHRCDRSEREPAYPRYPPLPVRSCRGHEHELGDRSEPADPDDDAGTR